MCAKNDEDSLLTTLMDLLNHRGFIAPTAEIYPSRIAGFYDFGPLGVLLKDNITELWRDIFVREPLEPIVYEISGAIVLPEDVLIASGHAESFDDPVVNCSNPKCDAALRADHLIEDVVERSVESLTIEELNQLIEENDIKCPSCGKDLEPIQNFNLMLDVDVGASHNSQHGYLRPETAQSIFLNYRMVQRSMRAKLPFGIAQIGNSFRNEISPRQGLIRMRAFNQMEIETFVDPQKVDEHPEIEKVKDVKINFIPQKPQIEATKNELPDPDHEEHTIGDLLESGDIINQYLGYYMGKEEEYYSRLGIPHEAIRFRHMTPAETPFYSKGNYDIEINTSVGWKEVVGNAYRTDHDLSTHEEHSNTKLQYHDQPTKRKFTPHVIEPSFGVERTFYSILEHCYREKGHDRDWAWFQFPPEIAPRQVHIYPLSRKDKLTNKAKEVFLMFKKEKIESLYDQRGSIGKRYARADEIGTPYCVTIDYDTVEKEPSMVTIRDRDTTDQVVVPVSEVVDKIKQLVKGEIEFLDAGEKFN